MTAAHQEDVPPPGLKVPWMHPLAGVLALGVVALLYHVPRLSPGAYSFTETECVASSLAQGHGFSSPFGGSTGPTAWVPPVPVWFEATVFKVFGIQTVSCAVARIVLTVLGLSLAHWVLICSVAPLGRIARFAASVTFLVTVAIIPEGPLDTLSEAWMTILLSVAVLSSCLGYLRSSSTRDAAALCVLAPIGVLTDAGLALALGAVILGLAVVGWRRGRTPRGPILAAALACLGLAGWTTRNAVALKAIVPLKSNLWFELYLANVVSRDGLVRAEDALVAQPFFHGPQWDRYRAMGEVAYVRSFKEGVTRSLAADPGHFAANVRRRLMSAVALSILDTGGAITWARFPAQDVARLQKAELLLPLPGIGGSFWRKLDASPDETFAALSSLGLSRVDLAWRDWAEHRSAYDKECARVSRVAAEALMSGVPFLSLLLLLLIEGRRVSPVVLWSALIAVVMLLPFVIINLGPRHQIPVIGLMAVWVGALVEAVAGHYRALKHR